MQFATGCGLIEGPVGDWHGLYSSDVLNGSVFLLEGPREDFAVAGLGFQFARVRP